MKICSAALKLLRAYTWTDEAIVRGPAEGCQCT